MDSRNAIILIEEIEEDGWYLVRVKGSHHQFRHATKKGLVTIKHPQKDIPLPTFKSIKKQAGL
ncbi:type II toxin-antitoxin system HicA family toxin [Arsenophonus sp. PmNCSU2021_1]|uniref:type II toxin-antitoxin system HicA family toxin n=1 Tax=Arsenophonus sp. PmNCSU2021_1 TaxID=3118989 RepID=UPI002FEE93EE